MVKFPQIIEELPYSDIAIGTAQILGVKLMENFRQPYLSRSVREFWRRWHISLSTWFRDYLYIPLGGSRVKFGWVLVNLMIVFVVSGLWHGANWTFAIWGLLHGLYVVGEVVADRLKISVPVPQIVKIVFTFALVSFAWIFFRANSLDDAGYVVTHLLDLSNISTDSLLIPFSDDEQMARMGFGMAALVLVILSLVDWVDARWNWLTILSQKKQIVRWAIYYVLAVAVIFSIIRFSNTPEEFIYFQF
jgi:alginate O-acetyltransferase complex protein AlgI